MAFKISVYSLWTLKKVKFYRHKQGVRNLYFFNLKNGISCDQEGLGKQGL